MKKLLLLLLLVPLISFGQTKEGLQLCLAMQSNNFMSDTEAENALDRILNTIGASKNFILVPCGEISNAAATSYNGIRYILYDKEFMQLISSRTNNWSNLAILAHEVGHHINGHVIDITMNTGGKIQVKSLENKRKQELEADEFAGFILARLGASLNNALSFTNIFSDKDDSYSTHPSKSKRVNAVRKGFNKAGGNSSVVNSNKVEKEYKRKSSEKNLESYFNSGIKKIRSQDFQNAIVDFNIVVKINPNYDLAYAQRAYAKSHLNQKFGAIEDYSKAIKLNPKNVFYYLNRGLEHDKLGASRNQKRDHYKAISDFSKVIEINPDYPDAYMNRGVSKFNLKKYYEAINDYSKAIELNPDYDLAYSNRGVSKDILKQYKSALKDHNIAIYLNPKDSYYYFNRAITKYNLNNLNGACDDWHTSLRFGNSDVNVYIEKFCD